MKTAIAKAVAITPLSAAPPAAISFTIKDCFDFAIPAAGIEGWLPVQWQLAEGGYIVNGCVPSGTFVRGPRKGQPKFRPGTPGTHRTIILTEEQLTARAVAYEAAGDKCWNCKGEGRVAWGWSETEGTTHRPCSRCSGSGSPQARGE